jgi:hypothetical protein
MKKNSVCIALVLILLVSLACNIGSTAPATDTGQADPPGTNAVSTEAAGGDDGPAGPESIDLTDPALYIIPGAPAYKYDTTLQITGMDTAGNPKEFRSFTSVEVQTLPQINQHIFFEGDTLGPEPSNKAGSINILSSDTVIIGDEMTSAQMVSVNGEAPKLSCHTAPTSSVQGPGLLESTLQFMPNVQQMVTGQALRVESGVEVNGYITDKYQLSIENFVQADGELISAFVYVARDGGFITRFEDQAQNKMDFFGRFDPNQMASLATTTNYFLVEDGSLNISVPSVCLK